MGILNEPDNTTAAENDDKTRLFETQEREGKSARDHAKFLLPIVLFVVAAVAAGFYFSLPAVGDKVRPSNDLYDAVYDHIVTTEKRTVTDMSFYTCGDFYWARVEVEPQEPIPGKTPDTTVKYKVRAKASPDGSWALNVVPIVSTADDAPCNWTTGF